MMVSMALKAGIQGARKSFRRVLNTIITKKATEKEKKMASTKILFKSDSNLTLTELGKLSY